MVISYEIYKIAEGFPGGIWCENDVGSTSMRRHHVASTLIRRHFGTKCPLGCFIISYEMTIRVRSSVTLTLPKLRYLFINSVIRLKDTDGTTNSVGPDRSNHEFLVCLDKVFFCRLKVCRLPVFALRASRERQRIFFRWYLPNMCTRQKHYNETLAT